MPEPEAESGSGIAALLGCTSELTAAAALWRSPA